MGLPRRYFNTASSNTTTDIVRSRDAFNTKIIDSNDVAGAAVVKENIDKITLLENRLLLVESNNVVGIGTIAEFIVALDSNK